MLKLNVGLSRKVGEANYGSRGASVNLELEVEAGLANEPDALRERVRQLFRMARSSVDEELEGSGHVANGQNNGHTNGQYPPANGRLDHANGNGYRHENGYGSQQRPSSRMATASQVKALHAISRKFHVDLAGELRDRFGVARPDDLSIGQASQLIDVIKPQESDSSGRR
ncbi:hypothetical protein [Lignipirellula cremea]|uniref:Uncharacterized protein n=1 Tax=Lignipirellula cremea TaxID=2528010 RepID=A0A518E3V1_9BACT|nr:hypothetical protein [Lignipirellula cremea]QDU98775.1 hypothetical protein Pla8534_66490 [Lignipirellula cremea]